MRPLLVADDAQLERVCDRARCPLCMLTGGEAVANTQPIVCKSCGQFIADYDFTAESMPHAFVVTLVPTDLTHSIHALRHFPKSAWRNFGLKCTDLKETRE